MEDDHELMVISRAFHALNKDLQIVKVINKNDGLTYSGCRRLRHLKNDSYLVVNNTAGNHPHLPDELGFLHMVLWSEEGVKYFHPTRLAFLNMKLPVVFLGIIILLIVPTDLDFADIFLSLTLTFGGYMHSSYFRICCALSAMIGFHIASTPPHPPPSENESVPSTSLEILLRQRAGQFIIKTICWATTFAEIATIISKDRSELWIFKFILKLLAVSPSSRINERSSLLFFSGTFMATLGGYIRWRCYKALGRSFTFEMSIREDHKLVMDGPYSLVRHPGYTGILLAVAGMIIWHTNPGSWARECGIIHTQLGRVMVFTYFSLTTSILLGLISRMALEDAALQRVFGEQWNNWAKRVPYKLIPYIY